MRVWGRPHSHRNGCCVTTGTKSERYIQDFNQKILQFLFSNLEFIFSKLDGTNAIENSNLSAILLYGDVNLTQSENCIILENTIDFIRGTGRFSRV